MSAQHTPGPWCCEHIKGSDSMYRTEVFSAEHGGIATCKWTPKNLGSGVTGTYREANARLIAAAPDLLEALQVARRWMRSGECNCYQAADPDKFKADEAMVEAAIAKATGQKGGA